MDISKLAKLISDKDQSLNGKLKRGELRHLLAAMPDLVLGRALTPSELFGTAISENPLIKSMREMRETESVAAGFQLLDWESEALHNSATQEKAEVSQIESQAPKSDAEQRAGIRRAWLAEQSAVHGWHSEFELSRQPGAPAYNTIQGYLNGNKSQQLRQTRGKIAKALNVAISEVPE